jgi:integrase
VKTEIESKTGAQKAPKWQRTSVTNLLRNGKSGVYHARVKIGGKQKWRSLDTPSFGVAKLRLADVEKQLRAQSTAQAVTFSDPSSLTVGEYIDTFLSRTDATPSLAASSKLRRHIALKAILKTWPDLRGRDIRRVTRSDCENWATQALGLGTGFRPPGARAAARKGMSPSAFNKCLDTLRAVFEIARSAGVIYSNPAAEVGKAKVKPTRLELPSAEQFRRLVGEVETAGARQSRDCANLVRFLAFSGLRHAEAGAITWKHVDFEKNALHVPGTKTQTSNRTIPLFPPLRDLLERMKAESEEGPANESGAVLNVKECAKALHSACERLGLGPLTHHDLRHLFATRCIESGVDIPTVSRWLGHSDGGALAMRTYGHLRNEHSMAQAAKVSF